MAEGVGVEPIPRQRMFGVYKAPSSNRLRTLRKRKCDLDVEASLRLVP